MFLYVPGRGKRRSAITYRFPSFAAATGTILPVSRRRRRLALWRRPGFTLPSNRVLFQRVAYLLAGGLGREIDNPALHEVAVQVVQDEEQHEKCFGGNYFTAASEASGKPSHSSSQRPLWKALGANTILIGRASFGGLLGCFGPYRAAFLASYVGLRLGLDGGFRCRRGSTRKLADGRRVISADAQAAHQYP